MKSVNKSPFSFEEIPENLTDRQRLFCMHYVENRFNGTDAARKAGYDNGNAASYAVYLLKNPNITQYINECKADLSKRIGVSAEMIAREYMKMAFVDISEVISEDGNLKQVSEMGDNAKAAISSIKVNEINSPDKLPVVVKEIRLHSKIDSLDKLAKMIGVDGVSKQEMTVKGLKLGKDVETYD